MTPPTHDDDVNVAALMAEVREAVARRRRERGDGAPAAAVPHLSFGSANMAETNGRNGHHGNGTATAPAGGLSALRPRGEWALFGERMSKAETSAGIGSELPRMASVNKIFRPLARLVARVLWKLLRPMTTPQREYNVASLEALRLLQQNIGALEQGQRADVQRLEALLGQAAERMRQLERQLERQKANLVEQERRVGILLEETRRHLGTAGAAPLDGCLAEEQDHLYDSVYVPFEDEFRGTFDDIKDRLKIYLPILKGAGIGGPDMPVLDVGTGRGEWLTLLREEGLHARGIDLNRVMVERCRGLGLDVTQADTLAHLRGLPDRSLGAVTGFHIIEHLPIPVLMALLDETARVLKPGGACVFETPNPANVFVSTHQFYYDLTHRKPLPSAVVKFLAEARGLSRVEIMNLHPFPEAVRLRDGTAVAERFNEVFYGPQDYAVVGWKP